MMAAWLSVGICPMHAKPISHFFRPSAGWVALCCAIFCATAASSAWAYKVERVCEMTEPTLKKPSIKVCKTLLVKTGADGKPVKKEEKKEEKPAAGHH